MSAAVAWGTAIRTPHGECDCPDCVAARAKIREARARLREVVSPIPERVFELLALEVEELEPRDPYLRAVARAAVVERWVELAAEAAEAAEEELAAALSRAVAAREELVERCELAEVSLPILARDADEARASSPWATISRHDEKFEEDRR